uniref:Tetratricopeptide repeat-containing protein n=1 Tax=Candidatus Kentrum sp. SD TaxID=2126332 RepID=A0A451BKM3_9GAMM|nr:MAG: Tetratricopeptide repeat-containing protein [Candidatus Kentron sp. SD]
MAFYDGINGDPYVFFIPSDARNDASSTVALHENFRTRVIRLLHIFITLFVFAFFATGFSVTNAAPSRCESLEFLCVVGTAEQHADNHSILTLEEIRALADQRNFDSALEGIRRFLDKEPDHLEGRLLLGVLLIWRGNPDGAVRVFRELADDHPNLAEPHNNLAAIYTSNQQYRKAEDALNKAISVNPSYGIAWENLGDIRIKRASLLYERASALYASNEDGNVGVESGIEEKSAIMEKVLGKIGYSFRVIENVQEILQDRVDVGATMVVEDPIDVNIASLGRSPAACYSVGPLIDKADFLLTTEWFKGNDIFTSSYTREREKSRGYEVFIPPLGNRGKVEAFIEKMRADGIDDVTLINGDDLENGAVIGVFDTESAAKHRIDELWKKGYNTKHRPRTGIEKQYWIKAYPTMDSSLDKLAFARRFPAYPLRAILCE